MGSNQLKTATAVVAWALVLGLISSASAELLVYEPFDYEPQLSELGLANQNGGMGFDEPWSGNAWYGISDDGSLGYTDSLGNVLETAGNRAYSTGPFFHGQGGRRSLDTANMDPNLLTPEGALGKNGTQLWLSFTYQSPDEEGKDLTTEKDWRSFQLRYTPDNTGVWDIGEKWDGKVDGNYVPNHSVGPGFGGSSADDWATASEIPIWEKALVVCRMDFLEYDFDTETGRDEIRMWVNPTLSVDPSIAEPDGGPAYVNGDENLETMLQYFKDKDDIFFEAQIDEFLMAQGSSPYFNQTIDEIRLGTTYADVVPYTTGGVAGDYNGNGIVDAADYTKWRDTLGDTVEAGTGADGDGNGTVGPEDYTFWMDRFGNTSGSGSGANGGAQAVPEPSTCCLLLLAAGLCWSRRRWRA